MNHSSNLGIDFSIYAQCFFCNSPDNQLSCFECYFSQVINNNIENDKIFKSIQLANSSMQYDPLYDADKGSKVMPSSFHDIGDVEFQDNWGRVWYGISNLIFMVLYTVINWMF